MSAAEPARLPADFRLRRDQAWAVALQELRRGFLRRSSLVLYGIALFPSVIAVFHALYAGSHDLAVEEQTLAGVFQFYYLRVAIFFGCLGVFTRLFRGEVTERTLHHYFLAPIRREILVVGKFVGAALGASVVFGAGFALFFVLHWGHLGATGWDHVWHGGGLAAFAAYELIILLAVVGFGAVFLVLGILFRNAGVPALLFMVWETFSTVLPPWFQRMSVTFYLRPLFPMELPPEGPLALFGVVVEPVAAPLAVLGLLAFAAIVVGLACLRIRPMEINYSTD